MAKKKGGFLRLVGWALLAAAVAKELRKPEDQREWHGRVGGVVPYDFRAPTLERIRRSWWNPSDERILTEPVFGIGWAINLARAARELRGEG
jgi:hypothetical protein